MTKGTSVKNRLSGIDALRGLAVILMVEQHMGIWFWDKSDRIMDFFNFPVIITLNAMGGFAAPAFITLSGTGAVLLAHRYEGCDKILVKRGFIILLFGYLLNIITPSWFSWGSWYVLHMIGAGFILSPLLRRLKPVLLAVSFIVFIIVAISLQNWLNTPYFIYNDFMRDTGRPGGILRLALAEGQFPLFPWLAMFTGGILSGQWIMRNKIKNIFIFASVVLAAGAALSVVHLIGPDLAKADPFKRFFWLYPGFYPAHPPMFLILASLAQFGLAAFLLLGEKIHIKETHFLVTLGRGSLTILFLHIFIFREMTQKINLWKFFSSWETLGIISAVILLFALLTVIWQKAGYKFGFEWFLRKLD